MTTMTDAERDAAIIADWSDTAANGTMPPELRLDMARLIALARIGAKVVAADDVRIDYVKFDKEALDRLQRDLVALASVGE